MPQQPAHILLPAIVAISIALMLVRPWGIREVWWVSGGALLLIALRLIPLHAAAAAVAKGEDVYLFLLGMMLLSELASELGLFDWVATTAIRGANGSRSRLFLLVYLVGIAVTAFMSNDATAVVLTPAMLAAVRKAKAPPLPYLFICALVANAASFVLPLSNPANLVVFNHGMPPIGSWMSFFGLPSALSIAATFGVMRWIFRKDLCGTIEATAGDAKLSVAGKMVLAGLPTMVAVLLTASARNKDLGLPAFFTAAVILAVLSIKTRTRPFHLLRKISWGTLLLVAGLFIMVSAVENMGALNLTRSWLLHAASLGQDAGAWAVGFAVAVANNLVNNLPLGLIAGGTLRAAHTKGLLVNAVMIGVDLGPNLSVTGSLATILWLIALRRENLNVSFWKFLQVGLIAMPVALAAALGGAILMARL